MTSPSSRHEPGGSDRRERRCRTPSRVSCHELQAQSALDGNFFAVASEAPMPHFHRVVGMPPGASGSRETASPSFSDFNIERGIPGFPGKFLFRAVDDGGGGRSIRPVQRRLRPSLHSETRTSRMFQPSQSIMSMISACAPRSSSESRLTKSAPTSMQTPGRR